MTLLPANFMHFRLTPKPRFRDGFTGCHDFPAKAVQKLIIFTPDFQMCRAAIHKVFQRDKPQQELLLFSFGKRRIAEGFGSRNGVSPCSGWLSYIENNQRTNHNSKDV
ncbi:hypothetical protein [Ochrobactrum sp. A-1]|uniref:hypothetical protein n=1 Tax=Ochrobactrum sp. A-1 TaxID=2920940 RepID=UPI001F0A5382|nr:hypothetical protein [Ochrobactrum sp. A-1]